MESPHYQPDPVAKRIFLAFLFGFWLGQFFKVRSRPIIFGNFVININRSSTELAIRE